MAILQQLVLWLEWVPWEWVGVASALVFVWLAAWGYRACWVFAVLSTWVYCLIGWREFGLLEWVLNSLYLIIAAVGWFRWRQLTSVVQARPQAGGRWPRRRSRLPDDTLPDTRLCSTSQLHAATHVYLIGLLVVVTVLAGKGLGFFQPQAPFYEVFIACSGLLGLWLLALAVLDGWLYWIVADTTAALLHLMRGEDASGMLSAVFVLMATLGFMRWFACRSEANPSGGAPVESRDVG